MDGDSVLLGGMMAEESNKLMEDDNDSGVCWTDAPPLKSVDIVSNPVPYLQLCYDERIQALGTLLVGSNSWSTEEMADDDQTSCSGGGGGSKQPSSSSEGASMRSNTTTDDNDFSSLALSDVSMSSSSSSNQGSGEQILWLDSSWYYRNEFSHHPQLDRALLLGAYDDEESIDCWNTENNDDDHSGCGKLFRHCAPFRRGKAPYYYRVRALSSELDTTTATTSRRNLHPHRLVAGRFNYTILRD